jgi:hypothetical protein
MNSAFAYGHEEVVLSSIFTGVIVLALVVCIEILRNND